MRTLRLIRARDAADPWPAFVDGADEIPATRYVRVAADGSQDAVLPWPRVLELLRRARYGHEWAVELQAILAGFLKDIGFDTADLAACLDQGSRVGLTLQFEALELFALPWGEVPLGPGRGPSAREPGLDLRFEHIRARAPTGGARTGHPGRVLLAHAGRVPDLGHKEVLIETVGVDRFETLPALTLNGLTAALAEGEQGHEKGPFTVLHLLAHGTALGARGDELPRAPGLAGAQETIGGRELADELLRAGPSLRLVVLCVCGGADEGLPGGYVGSLALELHAAGVRAVVGSRSQLGYDRSTAFARRLYEGLTSSAPPRTLDRVLADAREAIARPGPAAEGGSGSEASAVRLFARSHDVEAGWPWPHRPYRGLQAFGREDAAFFFGQSRRIEQLRLRLRALVNSERPNLLIVEGGSGTGKSSLVAAGLAPRLLESGLAHGDPEARAEAPADQWRFEGPAAILSMVPGEDPSGALDAIEGRVREAAVKTSVLLIVDQLEELFTTTPEALRAPFVQRLWSLAATIPGLLVVATMRSDFRGRCAEIDLGGGEGLGTLFRRPGPENGSSPLQYFYVGPLDREELRRVIVGPATAVGLKVDDGVVERIVGDFQEGRGTLPLVSHTLDRLWRLRDADCLTLATYDRIGGIEGALDRHAEEVYTALYQEARLAAKWLLVRLVNRAEVGSTRRRVRLDDLRPPEAMRARTDAFKAAVGELVGGRLLVTGSVPAGLRGDQETVEPAHESLLVGWKRLDGWMRDEEVLKALRPLEAFDQAARSGRIGGKELEAAEGFAAQHPHLVSPRLAAALAAGVAGRRRRRLLGAAAVALVGAVLVFAVHSVQQQGRAEAERAELARVQGEQSDRVLGEMKRLAEVSAPWLDPSARRTRVPARSGSSEAPLSRGDVPLESVRRGPVGLRGPHAAHVVDFVVPSRWALDGDATLELRVAHSSRLDPDRSFLTVWLDARPVGTVPLDSPDESTRTHRLLFPIGPGSEHRLAFIATHRTPERGSVDDPALWSRLGANTVLTVRYRRVPAPATLSSWPAPFLDGSFESPSITIALPAQPSAAELSAAAHIAAGLGRDSRGGVLRLRAELGDTGSLGDRIEIRIDRDHVGYRIDVREDASSRLRLVGRDGSHVVDLARRLAGDGVRFPRAAAWSPPGDVEGATAEEPADGYLRASGEGVPLTTLGLADRLFVGYGSAPIRAEFDLPPTLDVERVVLDAVVSYNAAVDPRRSSLEAVLNGGGRAQFKLVELDGRARARRTLTLPGADLRRHNVLEMRLSLSASSSDVDDVARVAGAIHADSTIAYVGHAGRAPPSDLSVLAERGHPLTSPADLSRTTFVVDAAAARPQVQALLWAAAALGRAGGGASFRTRVVVHDPARDSAPPDMDGPVVVLESEARGREVGRVHMTWRVGGGGTWTLSAPDDGALERIGCPDSGTVLDRLTGPAADVVGCDVSPSLDVRPEGRPPVGPARAIPR